MRVSYTFLTNQETWATRERSLPCILVNVLLTFKCLFSSKILYEHKNIKQLRHTLNKFQTFDEQKWNNESLN